MATATIEIEVDAEAAKAFSRASKQERKKMQLLLDLQLRQMTSAKQRSLTEIMDEMGAAAKARGLTPEKLEQILSEE